MKWFALLGFLLIGCVGSGENYGQTTDPDDLYEYEIEWNDNDQHTTVPQVQRNDEEPCERELLP